MRTALRLLLSGLALAACLQLVNCRLRPSPAERALAVYPDNLRGVPSVRILVRDDLPSVRLSVTGPYELRAEPVDPARPVLGGGDEPVTVTVRPTVAGLVLGNPQSPRARAPYPALAVVPVGETRVLVDGVDYGGGVVLHRVVPVAGGEAEPRLRVVARVNLEQYLVGVVPNEMPASWDVEALRAQCVAARSYALYKIKTRGHLAYDVRDTTASQVWRPGGGDNPVVNMVVNSTRGVVMTDTWRLFPAYYSAQCGGYTKDGADVFINRHILPLAGVRCPFCQPADRAGLREWVLVLPLEAIAERLAARGFQVGRITGLRALDADARTREEMGRVYDVTVLHEGAGRMLTVPALTFRAAMNQGAVGEQRFYSTYFRIDMRRGEAVFEGRGHGHGVGLCQYGARHLARQGRSYAEILAWYYNGHHLVRLW